MKKCKKCLSVQIHTIIFLPEVAIGRPKKIIYTCSISIHHPVHVIAEKIELKGVSMMAWTAGVRGKKIIFKSQ